MLKALDAWQCRIEARYDLSVSVRVSDHVFSDQATRKQWTACDVREQLLILQEADGIALSLFLDERLADAAVDSLDAQAAIVEGVSHFVCVAWRAERDTSCTALELELQAEIDKFVLLLSTHGPPERLFTALFEKVRFSSALNANDRQRYIFANRLAAQACQWLLYRFEGRLEHPNAVAWLRRFYRMPAQQKYRLLEHGQ